MELFPDVVKFRAIGVLSDFSLDFYRLFVDNDENMHIFDRSKIKTYLVILISHFNDLVHDSEEILYLVLNKVDAHTHYYDFLSDIFEFVIGRVKKVLTEFACDVHEHFGYFFLDELVLERDQVNQQ